MRGPEYQIVASEEDGGVTESFLLNERNSQAGEARPPPLRADHVGGKSRAKPSVHQLLPYFFLTSLAFGLTMVPRVSVLVTLICQQLVDNDMSTVGLSPRQHEMPAGEMSSHEMPGSDMNTNGTAAGNISMGSYDARCSTPRVTANVAFMSTYRDLTTGIIGAIMSYYLGKLSDRVGRVRVMALNGVGILISELVMVLVVAFPDYLNYRWLFLSFVLDGLSGSFPLLMATASTYVTDSTSDKDRVVAMGWIQSGMFLGMAVGPALGSALSGLSGPDRPSAIFVYSLSCRVIALAFLTILPESLPNIEGETKASGPRSRHSMWTAMSFKSMPSFNILDALFPAESSPSEKQKDSRNLILLMAISSIMFGSAIGAMDVMMLYPQATFQWGMMETGNFISIINIFRTLSTTLFLRLLLRIFAKRTSSESTAPDQASPQVRLSLLRLALFSDILGYLGFGVAPTGFWFVAAGILSSLSAMGLSTTQASMSMMVSPEHVGTLMGILGSLQALTRLVSPPVINLIYAWTVSFLPQVLFFGLAATNGVGAVMTFLLRHG